MAINEAIQSSCACYSAEITTPSRALGRSQRWQDGTTWCLVSPATALASWHENHCHQLLLGWSLCEQQMLLELSAKELLHSQGQVLDMMVLRLAWVLLDTTVGCERKCYKMKETVDVIKNVMSNEAWGTADTTLTHRPASLSLLTAMWRCMQTVVEHQNKHVGWNFTQCESGAATQTTLQLLQICTAVPESRILMHGLY